MFVRLDPVTGQPVGDPLIGHTNWVVAVAAVPLSDGRTLLATGSGDAMVRLWDPVTGQPVGDLFTGHTDTVVAAVPLPDGRTLLATASDDATVRLWDPTNGQMLATLATTQPIRSLCAFSGSASASAFLAIVGSDGVAVIDCLAL